VQKGSKIASVLLRRFSISFCAIKDASCGVIPTMLFWNTQHGLHLVHGADALPRGTHTVKALPLLPSANSTMSWLNSAMLPGMVSITLSFSRELLSRAIV
jgi:hypothetical protein